MMQIHNNAGQLKYVNGDGEMETKHTGKSENIPYFLKLTLRI